MNKMFWLAFALLVIGCEGSTKREYQVGSTVQRVNGVVVKVEIRLPIRCGEPMVISVASREEAERLIDALESVVLDLKTSRDQMPAVEPKGSP